MAHLKNSMAFMMLLSVGTLLPAEVAQLFARAQTVGSDALNYAKDSSIGLAASNAFNEVQLWTNNNPKIAGALIASIVCGCLFALWRKNLKKRMEKDLNEAWMDGYEAAQDECDELLTEAVKESEITEEEIYKAGWQSAMNQVHQMQQDPDSVTEYRGDQQELDQYVTALCDDLLFQLAQDGGIFSLQMVAQ